MARNHWPSDHHEQTFRAFLVGTHLLLDQLDRELQREAAMPLAYFKILACLAEAPERSLRMSDLADYLHGSRSRLSHAIARLEAQGWVERCACDLDKRGTYAVLTDRGFAAVEAATPTLVRGAQRHLFDHLSTTQIEHLRAIHELLSTHLCTGTPADSLD